VSGSLKGRMIRALVLWIVIAWTVSVGTMYVFTTYSQTSNWDDKLQSIAIQVWHDRAQLVASTPGAPAKPLQPQFTEGFANVQLDAAQWRVYSVSDRSGRYQVQIGNERALIDAEFQKHSLKAVTLAAVSIGLAGFLMWLSVNRTLRPLAAIEKAMRDRSRFDLQPLPTATLPSELQPLVGSFNHLLQQLDQAMQAERQFISDAAHELRTPLSALQARLDVALRARSEEERAAELQKLLVAVQRSSRLAEQLLDLARLEAGERAQVRSRCDLQEIVQHVANEFDISASRQQRSIELAVQSCPIECDVDEIGILVRNLVDNALRYTVSGGKVRISCGRRESAEGARVFLEVADDGPGVPPEEQAAIFERFHRVRTTREVRGSGIGLSLVARIARLHGAQIEIGEGFGNPGLSVRVLFQGLP
jgi:signal transduction histidine kinase